MKMPVLNVQDRLNRVERNDLLEELESLFAGFRVGEVGERGVAASNC